MKLYEIKPLVNDMRKNNVLQDRFSFVYSKKRFDVVILLDREPYELLFGIIDENYFFTLKLFKGFELETLSDKVFYELCNILNLKPSKEEFNSFKFLKYFASRIPLKFSGNRIQPEDIAVFKSDKIDEKEKKYFKGWLTHVTDGRNARNLQKTKELLGDEAYKYCKEHNISSKWSDKLTDKQPYYPPNKI